MTRNEKAYSKLLRACLKVIQNFFEAILKIQRIFSQKPSMRVPMMKW